MRVLCLHGMGTNAAIFEAQTEMFRNLLPEHFEYDFFDAEHEIAAAEGCGEIFPGPYTCWYPVPTNANVKSAHQVVEELIQEEGPYDVVMGFSQGAALAASVIMTHQLENPLSAPLFKLAIFICGSLPYCTDGKRGVDAARLFAQPPESGFGPPKYITYQPSLDDGSATPRGLYSRKDKAQDSRPLSELMNTFKMTSITEKDWKTIPVAPSMNQDSDESEYDSRSESEDVSAVFSPVEGSSETSASSSDDEGGSEDLWQAATKVKQARLDGTTDDHIIRRFHADNDSVRIQIPTAHIFGKTDPYCQQSKELRRLCDPQWSTAYEHPQGHLVPRAMNVNREIATAIERALASVEIASR